MILKKSFQSYKSRIWMDVKKKHSLAGPSLLLSFSAHSLLSVPVSRQDEVTNVFIIPHHLTECPQTVPPFSQSLCCVGLVSTNRPCQAEQFQNTSGKKPVGSICKGEEKFGR